MAERLASVLEVVYLIFNEGYSATAGDDWMRPALCEEALRLGRVLAGLAPAEPEVHGLVALMEIQASRLPARTGPDGEPVLLPDQDRRRWDRLLIRRGLAALATRAPGARRRRSARTRCRPRSRPATPGRRPPRTPTGPASPRCTRCSGTSRRRRSSSSTARWPSAWPRPGGGSGRARRSWSGERALAGLPLLPAVRGDLLARLGRPDEARPEFERAAG